MQPLATMTSEVSKNAHSMGDEDDNSTSSSGSGSTEDSSMEVPPPESIIMGKQIRQHARELLQLQSSPERIHDQSENNRSIQVERIPNPSNEVKNYQSYHDAPSATRATFASPPPFPAPDSTTITPPWASSDYGNSVSDGMSIADVVTMAFSCVAHCLTEGYRAASNYYGAYHQDQYPVPNMRTQNDYLQVASDHVEAYNSNNNTSNRSIYNDVQKMFSGAVPSKNGYEISQREVMERGETSLQTPGEASRKEEWETVQVPSSYQGGRVRGSN